MLRKAIPRVYQSLRWVNIRSMASAVSITATPSQPLVDEDLAIEVKGLEPGQKVTIASNMVEAKKLWQSHAHYTANSEGNIDLMQMPSEGGAYKGIEPMGLFWTVLVQSDPRARLFKWDVTTPYVTTLSVLPGHIDVEELDHQGRGALAETSVQRYLMTENVERIPIREGRLRGTLFVPKGPSGKKYPAILDLYGTTGGLVEPRAALLASHGFITFALAYFNYDDLPPYPVEPIQLEYFEEAVEFLDGHPNVISNNLGVIGISKGGEIALHISTITEKVKAVAAINSYFYNSTFAHSYKGKNIPCVFPDLNYAKKEGDWFNLEDSYDKHPDIEKCYIPVETSDSAEFLLIHGSKDCLVLPYNGMRVMRRLWDHGRHNATLHIYPGAGHIIEPPYTPVCKGQFHKVLGSLLLFGGERDEQKRAQEQAWGQILAFFHRILRPPSSQL